VSDTRRLDATRLQLRAAVGLSILLGILGCLLVRLFFIQVVLETRYDKAADAQQWTRVEVVPAQRGRILDRLERPLARSENAPTVAVDPAAIDPVPTARVLREELGVAEEEFARILMKGSRHFAYVRRQFADRDAVTRLEARVKALGLPGVIFLEESQRIHPMGNLAAQLLGFTDRDNRGVEGLERLLDRKLAGSAGRRVTLRDARSRAIVTASRPLDPPVDGEDVRLTIDATIQSFAEDAAQQSFERHKAKGTVAAVVDVLTGEILAVACRPTFDPAAPGDASADARRMRFFTDIFEPGSTFKPLVMSAALDTGAVSPTERFDCNDNRIGRRTIHEDEDHHYGVLDPAGIIARSSNVGMAHVGMRLGIKRCHAALLSFGFGARTALEWPGESNGQVEPLAQWTPTYTLCSVSFGHNVAVTPAQLLMAYAALANDGVRLAPRLLADVVAPMGSRAAAEVPVVSQHTAELLRPMLEEVLISGTAKAIKKTEYRIGGKTGTAQKLATGGVCASFACIGPLENPRLAALVVCDEPKQGHHGSVVAAPYAVDLLRASLHYLGVPRDGVPSDAEDDPTAPGTPDSDGDLCSPADLPETLR
jgi:cell division protein FtsI (penicillin-binding protein 3)